MVERWRPHRTVYQILAWNHAGWVRPVERTGYGAWNSEHGWAGEDWNFDLDAPVDDHILGFGQGTIGHARRARVGLVWDVVFYSRHPTRGHVLVGAYEGAEYLPTGSTAYGAACDRLRATGVARARRRQLKAAFADRDKGRAEAAVFEALLPIRWRVPRAGVHRFPTLPPSPARGDRYSNCHYNGLPPLQVILDALQVEPGDDGPPPPGLPETVEGRLVWRLHRSRERDPTIARAFKAARPRPLRCDACQDTHAGRYGETERVFEVHHTLPLGDRSKDGATTDPADLALLCANCHRFAHASGRMTVAALRDGLATLP